MLLVLLTLYVLNKIASFNVILFLKKMASAQIQYHMLSLSERDFCTFYRDELVLKWNFVTGAYTFES